MLQVNPIVGDILRLWGGGPKGLQADLLRLQAAVCRVETAGEDRNHAVKSNMFDGIRFTQLGWHGLQPTSNGL